MGGRSSILEKKILYFKLRPLIKGALNNNSWTSCEDGVFIRWSDIENNLSLESFIDDHLKC